MLLIKWFIAENYRNLSLNFMALGFKRFLFVIAKSCNVTFQFNIFTDQTDFVRATHNPLIKPRYNKASPFVSSARLALEV